MIKAEPDYKLLYEQSQKSLEESQKGLEQTQRLFGIRMILPENLEREKIRLDPEGDFSEYKVIGEEVTEVLVMIPASFRVKRIMHLNFGM